MSCFRRLRTSIHTNSDLADDFFDCGQCPVRSQLFSWFITGLLVGSNRIMGWKIGRAVKLQFNSSDYKFWMEFQQTAADFEQKLWVTEISILPLNFSTLGFSASNFAILGEHFWMVRWFFKNFRTVQNLERAVVPFSAPCHNTIDWHFYCI